MDSNNAQKSIELNLFNPPIPNVHGAEFFVSSDMVKAFRVYFHALSRDSVMEREGCG